MSELTIFGVGFASGLLAITVERGVSRIRERRGRKIRLDRQRSDLYEYGQAVANLRKADEHRQALKFEIDRCRPTLVRQFPPPPDKLKAELAAVEAGIAEQSRLRVMFCDAILARTR